jgi:hypothetical protein
MPRKVTKKEPFKELVFKGRYKDFHEFLNINRETVYKGILDVYTNLKTKEVNETLRLRIAAKIKGFDWDTNFEFKRGDYIVLKRDLMPFFESIEDYETCEQICKLHKDLISID